MTRGLRPLGCKYKALLFPAYPIKSQSPEWAPDCGSVSILGPHKPQSWGGAGYGIEAVPTVVMGGTLSVNLGSDTDSSWVTLGRFLVLSKPQLPHL